MLSDDKIFQEVDVFSLIKEIGIKNKVHQAKMLQVLENSIDDPKVFAEVRKFFLDEQNSYTRSIVRLIFGDIEFLHFNKKR